jgi:PhnB protein
MRNMVPNELIIPMLVCRNALSEIEFCKAAFGAVELSRRTAQDGVILHAALRIGAAMIMVHGEVPTLASRAPVEDGSSAVVIYLYLKGVDAVIDRATGAGARLLLPATDTSWGDRVGRVVDPEGHVWNIATRINEKNA